VPHKKLLLITIAFALLVKTLKIPARKAIYAGLLVLTTALIAILFKKYILAEQIADVAFFMLLIGTIYKFPEIRKL
jgi:hypothetical protein